VSVPSSELGPPAPYPASECVPPLGQKGRTHSPAGEGVGGPNSDDLKKKPSTQSSLCFKGWLMYHQLKRRVSCVELGSIFAWWHYATLFNIYLFFNIHSYNTIIHSLILHHLPRPVFLYIFIASLLSKRRTSSGRRAENRTRACHTTSRRTTN
jgi:hypothetical protein